jgi:hypothetical protein
MAGNTPSWARPGAVHRAPEGAGVAPRTRGVVGAKTTHGPPPGPLWPALQAHVLSAVLPGGECEFTGQLKQEPTAEAARVVEYAPAPQSRHVEAPVIILYFPASHAAHLPPSGPVYPGLHRQLVRRLLPLGETEYSGQLWHNSTSTEPKTALYVPAAAVCAVASRRSSRACEVLAGDAVCAVASRRSSRAVLAGVAVCAGAI